MTQVHQRDVVDVLLAQHEEIKALFSRVATAQGDRKRSEFYDLVRLLAVHESAEEQLVHPAARKAIGEGGQRVVAERLHEEAEAKRMLSDLYDLGVDHPEFHERLARCAQHVVAHATNEEREEFSQLRSNVGPEQLRRMAAVFEAAERAAPTRPHPSAGESATANIVLGPPLALFDKARDALRRS
ncbi:hemerythrin domain-containing protein [Dactylosporangium sp. NPDC051485]|uniref:hemerythrin domain-containing protein n=1 Tax=Dactylosporangium sp. NPDC051485 TaxID=3154846 RepID=UPI0034169957